MRPYLRRIDLFFYIISKKYRILVHAQSSISGECILTSTQWQFCYRIRTTGWNYVENHWLGIVKYIDYIKLLSVRKIYNEDLLIIKSRGKSGTGTGSWPRESCTDGAKDFCSYDDYGNHNNWILIIRFVIRSTCVGKTVRTRKKKPTASEMSPYDFCPIFTTDIRNRKLIIRPVVFSYRITFWKLNGFSSLNPALNRRRRRRLIPTRIPYICISVALIETIYFPIGPVHRNIKKNIMLLLYRVGNFVREFAFYYCFVTPPPRSKNGKKK